MTELKFPAFETSTQARRYRDTFTKGTHKVVKSRVFDIESGKYIPCYTVVRS